MASLENVASSSSAGLEKFAAEVEEVVAEVVAEVVVVVLVVVVVAVSLHVFVVLVFAGVRVPGPESISVRSILVIIASTM